MTKVAAELIGTMLLVTLGDGVVANVALNKSKGQNSGWIVVATGWGMAVALAIYSVGWISGGDLNPAVTLGVAAVGDFSWGGVAAFIGGQMVGALLGAGGGWVAFLPPWGATAHVR